MSSLLIVSASATAVVIAAVLAILAVRTKRQQERMILSIEALRWSAYVAVVRRLLTNLGYRVDNRPAPAANAGFDFEVEREGKRYVVLCRHGASILPTNERLFELHKTIHHAGASGALLFLTSKVDRAQQMSAIEMGIEIYSGLQLSRELSRLLNKPAINAPHFDGRLQLLREPRRVRG